MRTTLSRALVALSASLGVGGCSSALFPELPGATPPEWSPYAVQDPTGEMVEVAVMATLPNYWADGSFIEEPLDAEGASFSLYTAEEPNEVVTGVTTDAVLVPAGETSVTEYEYRDVAGVPFKSSFIQEMVEDGDELDGELCVDIGEVSSKWSCARIGSSNDPFETDDTRVTPECEVWLNGIGTAELSGFDYGFMDRHGDVFKGLVNDQGTSITISQESTDGSGYRADWVCQAG
jgi:hypothetical protein